MAKRTEPLNKTKFVVLGFRLYRRTTKAKRLKKKMQRKLKIIQSAFGLLLLCVGNADTWEIHIRGDGSTPAINSQATTLPSPPLPLPPPPRPVVLPEEPNLPFDFPSQPPFQNDGAGRYFNLCPAREQGCYASLPEFGNPLSGSHLFACYTPAGMRFNNNQSIGGFRLYVERGMPPALIRLLCSGGSL